MIGKHFGLLRMLTLQLTKIKKNFVTGKIMKFTSVWQGKGISIKIINHLVAFLVKFLFYFGYTAEDSKIQKSSPKMQKYVFTNFLKTSCL